MYPLANFIKHNVPDYHYDLYTVMHNQKCIAYMQLTIMNLKRNCDVLYGTEKVHWYFSPTNLILREQDDSQSKNCMLLIIMA